jgi:hypothetical protein
LMRTFLTRVALRRARWSLRSRCLWSRACERYCCQRTYMGRSVSNARRRTRLIHYSPQPLCGMYLKPRPRLSPASDTSAGLPYPPTGGHREAHRRSGIPASQFSAPAASLCREMLPKRYRILLSALAYVVSLWLREYAVKPQRFPSGRVTECWKITYCWAPFGRAAISHHSASRDCRAAQKGGGCHSREWPARYVLGYAREHDRAPSASGFPRELVLRKDTAGST